MTGATGFVGQWLCRELLAQGWDVFGLAHGDAPIATLTSDERARVKWLPSDIRDPAAVRAAMDASAPEAIFHLAGVSFVPTAAEDPGAALDVNVSGVARLLAEVRVRHKAGILDPVVLVIGSGLQYGRHGDSAMPLREDAEQRPLDLYAASKAAQEIVALEAFRADEVRVIATRSFNHSGPGQDEQFLIPRLVRRALAARLSGESAIALGNTTPVRDFLHVLDVVRAYIALVEHGTPGQAYNVASGLGHSVRSIAERLLALAGVQAELRSEPALQRTSDIPVLIGDSLKLRHATLWTPVKSLDDIITDLLNAPTH
ncbi:MAG: GDP-mannose 4,6-dehydratase [Anaerolineae bacterium]|nr:GDP-mannose 4,6-dehydratase [Gemmatimonadaceae bacterium]